MLFIISNGPIGQRRPTLALAQSIYVVIPHIISLIAITVICFGVSYTVFMRQEIRSA